MKPEKLITYGIIAVIAYVLYTKYQQSIILAKGQAAAAAGNSTAGIIGASLGGLGTVLSTLDSGDDSEFDD
jgi:hypothetical protein